MKVKNCLKSAEYRNDQIKICLLKEVTAQNFINFCQMNTYFSGLKKFKKNFKFDNIILTKQEIEENLNNLKPR